MPVNAVYGTGVLALRHAKIIRSPVPPRRSGQGAHCGCHREICHRTAGDGPVLRSHESGDARAITEGELPKGDVLAVARIAGIQALRSALT